MPKQTAPQTTEPTRPAADNHAAARTAARTEARIAAVLAARRAGLPHLADAVDRWRHIADSLAQLDAALTALSEQPAVPEPAKLILSALADTGPVRAEIAALRADLRNLHARLGRQTLNIGICGRARMGKSTFLQSASGLGEEQVPTGSGLPVTAVRSRLYHSATATGARVERLSPDRFVTEVVRPYYLALGHPQPPATLDAFAADDSIERLDPQRVPDGTSLLDDLLKMRRSLPRYREELAGDVIDVELDTLRRYVAYPTREELAAERDSGAVLDRHYLAVGDVQIRCAFPRADVAGIGLIDLPGLGELAPEAEAHHLGGLEHEVDAALIIVRPTDVSAFWDDSAKRAKQLIERACGDLLDPRDFAFIVINDDGARPDLYAALRDSILDRVNGGVDGRNYTVLTVDAKDPAAVGAQVLDPLLDHLAAHAGRMDAALRRGHRDRAEQLAARIRGHLGEIGEALRRVPLANSARLLESQSETLHRQLAAALKEVVDEYERRAREKDQDYQAKVEVAYLEVEAWRARGFGVGEDAWRANALAEGKVRGNVGGFVIDELNRIRVEMGAGFRRLDAYFADRVAELRGDVAAALEVQLGGLWKRTISGTGHGSSVEALAGQPDGESAGTPAESSAEPATGSSAEPTGDEALRMLAERLHDAADPCRILARAVEDLLDLTLDYNSHVYPWIAQHLRKLNQEYTDDAGVRRTRFVVELTESGTERLYQEIFKFTGEASYATRNALLDGDTRPAQVLAAAAEYFADAFLRSGGVRAEFGALSRSYQDELWPGLFAELQPQNANLTRVRLLARTLAELTEGARL
ncbi:hypothetical protein [Catenulispora acidiphila]|uniref:hypothetical protein n=1 Tax=Catenulispora acidiphila TaxID=304895 RepID=UPI00019DE818|nr:hypothetical protein [Catenulispora acidiphila]